jgi:hypothetical protein
VLIGTVQVSLEPLHAPLHERSFQPLAGVAVSRTGVKDANAAEHRGEHVIPACALRTTPRPRTETVSRKVAGANCAETAAPAFTASEHAADPEHAPPQRASFAPGLGVAVRVKGCPPFHIVVQLAEQKRPGVFALTVPGPEIESASGT